MHAWTKEATWIDKDGFGACDLLTVLLPYWLLSSCRLEIYCRWKRSYTGLRARAPGFSNVTSFLTFVSLFKAAELVNFLMRSGDKPLRRQLDSIQELHRRLLNTEPAGKDTDTADMDAVILRPFHYLLDQLLSGEDMDYSQMSLKKLQLRRCVSQRFTLNTF
ncbi:unnamed protein product [Dibothriocephalus latus]|uniref:Uncharacterized protein n=1 Tax=Dibothriocephalus latus TaxID=60516 RepID=A0A3P7Q0F4_DIBLA|nr:unnamed protein product [Dibothriocephalus latus]